jgi:hypothetical protein
MNTKHV